MTQQNIPSSPQPEAHHLTGLVVEYVTNMLTAPVANEELPGELRNIEKMQELHSLLGGIRNLIHALAIGKLEHPCKERGFVASSLKAFQSNLRHLTWQAQCLARGEYYHRVNFLNDFSVAFNQMAEQLGRTVNHLTTLSEEYKDLSHRDPLTNLYNRAAFFSFAEQLLLKNVPAQQNTTLIMADIDKFKNINDIHGHLCGDEVLREFAGKLLSILRSRDLCCRYGGEEFLILMPDTPLASGISIAERLRKTIEDMVIQYEKSELRITASFGLSSLGSMAPDQNFEDYLNTYIQLADDNMYTAKASGRNQVTG